MAAMVTLSIYPEQMHDIVYMHIVAADLLHKHPSNS